MKNIEKILNVTKTFNVQIKVEIKKEGLLCHGVRSFQYIWGTSTTPTDAGARSEKFGKYLITWERLKRRKNWMEDKIKKYQEGLKIMKNFAKEIK